MKLLFLLMLVAGQAWGVTYYVDPSTGSDANAGTVCASPIAGYAKAGFLAGLVAGDFVLQKSGTTYIGQLAPTVSGSAGNPITFGVYASCSSPAQIVDGSARAVVDGNGAASPVISITSRTDLTFIGFDAQGTNDAGGTACNVRAQLSSRIIFKYSTVRVGSGSGRCAFTDNRGATNTWSFLSATGMLQNGFLIYGPAGSAATDITITDSDFSGNNTAASSSNAGIKWGADDGTATLTGAIISRNVLSNNGGLAVGNGFRGNGVMLSSTISSNTSSQNKYGLWFDSTSDVDGTGDNYTGTVISGNTANSNQEFGILVNRVDFASVIGNTTNDNGADTATDFGRGIEIVGTTANHAKNILVRNNTASGNKNYIANGTEGVGIALDNFVDNSVLSGNFVSSNEGNGIQVFTCANCQVTGNVLVNNGVNYRGGSVVNSTKSEIGIGSASTVLSFANNSIASSCATQNRYGIAEANSSTTTGLSITNNSIIGACISAIFKRVATSQSYNAFYLNSANVLSAADDSALADGTGAVTSNPLFVGGTSPTTAAGFRTACGSPLIATGTVLGPMQDHGNRRFSAIPSIGAWEHGSGDARCTVTARTTVTPR